MADAARVQEAMSLEDLTIAARGLVDDGWVDVYSHTQSSTTDAEGPGTWISFSVFERSGYVRLPDGDVEYDETEVYIGSGNTPDEAWESRECTRVGYQRPQP